MGSLAVLHLSASCIGTVMNSLCILNVLIILVEILTFSGLETIFPEIMYIKERGNQRTFIEVAFQTLRPSVIV